ncbi:hypothetical protein [Klebsiella pneumoniae]|uniref:hypothetical protein n=1 Tax=Klebsiella pneumoniae TaxID=573 RepID=UPI00187C2729|nr:hypothetical protein [Klebsiella pneumoniae]
MQTGKRADTGNVPGVLFSPDTADLMWLRRNGYQVPGLKRNDHQPPSSVFWPEVLAAVPKLRYVALVPLPLPARSRSSDSATEASCVTCADGFMTLPFLFALEMAE